MPHTPPYELPTEQRLYQLEFNQARTDETMKDVAESLKTLTRIEAQNTALANEFKQLREETMALRKEVAEIQEDMPALRQIKSGAALGVRLILIAVFVAVLALVGLKVTH